jgi:hypothetical protein
MHTLLLSSIVFFFQKKLKEAVEKEEGGRG